MQIIARLPRMFAALIGLSLAAWCVSAQAEVKPKNANESAVIAFLDLIFNQSKAAEAFERYGGTYYRQHNPMFPDGKQVLIDAMKNLPPGMSIHYDIKRVLSDGAMVVVHSQVTIGPGRGNAVVDMFRIENGKIVEHWDVSQPIPESAANANTMF